MNDDQTDPTPESEPEPHPEPQAVSKPEPKAEATPPSPLERIGDFDASLNMAQAKAAAGILSQIPGLSPEQAVVLAKAKHQDLFPIQSQTNMQNNPLGNQNPSVSPSRTVQSPPPRQLTQREQDEKTEVETVRQLNREGATMSDTERDVLGKKFIEARRRRVGLPT